MSFLYSAGLLELPENVIVAWSDDGTGMVIDGDTVCFNNFIFCCFDNL